MSEVILQTELAAADLINRGKVRDIYRVEDNLLIVATDRISAFDSVLGSGIPWKGKVLTNLSVFWFGLTEKITPNHVITADVDEMPEALQADRDQIAGRAMLTRRAEVVPIECVVRGYLAGSAWREYSASGAVCGIELPPGMVECDRLPEPIFTPATKAESGHDENISFEQMVDIVGEETARALSERSLAVYNEASAYAAQRGVIISDTKFEWGVADGELIVIDEMLTPDSSRFWPADAYEPGHAQPSFDKQFVRDYLEESGWDKEPPAPALPDDIVEKTTQNYLEAYRRLTGEDLVAKLQAS